MWSQDEPIILEQYFGNRNQPTIVGPELEHSIVNYTYNEKINTSPEVRGLFFFMVRSVAKLEPQ